jgi:iron complex outermembrane receptor protein
LHRLLRQAAVGACLSALALECGAQQLAALPLLDLSLEELSSIRVTSVSRAPEPWSQAPASVYVITGEEIRRSGATTLPEALRLAPNLLVARMDAAIYAISARGFNSNIANKLLVMVDGRTIYSPLFSGVFWELHDVMLEDVERIEVISGPGGAQWGTNAVNGVINVVTRPAADTQGALAKLGAGGREALAAFRYGGALGGGGAYRVYGKAWKAHDIIAAPFNGAADGHDRAQTGFRADWRAGSDGFTLQGDMLSGGSDNRPRRDAGGIDVAGANLLGRWTRQLGEGSQLQLQAYFDHSVHRDSLLLDEVLDLFDIELRHGLPLGRHRLQWGAGYRHAREESEPGLIFSFRPARKTLQWASLFVQDQVQLFERLELTLGLRLEENDYTGWESLPNARLAWKIGEQSLLWTSLSRAVRAPSRVDREIFVTLGGIDLLAGGPRFDSEIADVAELGWRSRLTRDISASLTAYLQEYDRLATAEGFPLQFENLAEGRVKGLEGWGHWQAARAWRLSAGFATIDSRLRFKPQSDGFGRRPDLGDHPDFQWMLRSSANLGERQELDVLLRRVGELPIITASNTVPVPAYTALDLRYGWHLRRDLELAFVVRNALDAAHREWGDTTTSGEVRRSALLTLQWMP